MQVKGENDPNKESKIHQDVKTKIPRIEDGPHDAQTTSSQIVTSLVRRLNTPISITLPIYGLKDAPTTSA